MVTGVWFCFVGLLDVVCFLVTGLFAVALFGFGLWWVGADCLFELIVVGWGWLFALGCCGWVLTCLICLVLVAFCLCGWVR